jgi:DNA/RNA endonuclease YhcR with UshA esterase domain
VEKKMKPLLFLILTVLFSMAPAMLAIDTIQPAEAPKHAGEEVYVEGVVASVHTTPKGTAFINLDKAYPNQVFTGFIQNLSAIGDEAWLNGLKGKTVRIHGRINIYHGIPEIRITSKDQVVSE